MPTFPAHIPTKEIRASDVPEIFTAWNEIGRFALTFDPNESDPYAIKDQSFDVMTSATDLVELRARLFLEQRRWNHFGRVPDEAAMAGVRKILALIKVKLTG